LVSLKYPTDAKPVVNNAESAEKGLSQGLDDTAAFRQFGEIIRDFL
jgi:hypothetical protein